MCPHAVFAIIPQSVFVLTILAKLNFVFPLFAFGTVFLLHAINGAISLLISEVFFHRPPVFPVISAFILTAALFAPIPQPIFVLTILTKLTLVFPLSAFCTLLHLLRLSVYVLLLIPDSQIGQQHFYVFPFRFLFLRPNLTILNLVACTDLPILSAICCAVLLGYSFFSRFSSIFDQTGDFLSPNLYALRATAETVRPSWFAISRMLLSGCSFLSRASSCLDQTGAVPTFLMPRRDAFCLTRSEDRPSLSAMLCVFSLG